eukprot:4975381-Prymnesium_polylepis.1
MAGLPQVAGLPHVAVEHEPSLIWQGFLSHVAVEHEPSLIWQGSLIWRRVSGSFRLKGRRTPAARCAIPARAPP